MNRKTFKALERIFLSEMDGRLVFKSKAKIYKELEKEGLVCYRKREFRPDRFGLIVVCGWVLTHKGRADYCYECSVKYPEKQMT